MSFKKGFLKYFNASIEAFFIGIKFYFNYNIKFLQLDSPNEAIPMLEKIMTRLENLGHWGVVEPPMS